MNYIKIYNSLIERALNRKLEGYKEKHHIIPKCLGGNNLKSNICLLTAREHYVAHRLLVRIYPEEPKLAYAFWAMCNGITKERKLTNSHGYEEARLLVSTLRKNKNVVPLGFKHSEETKRKISEANKGHKRWIGKSHTEESKMKQSESAKTRNIDPDNEALRRDKISTKLKGFTRTPENVVNISEAKKGNKNPMFGKKYRIVDGKRIFYCV